VATGGAQGNDASHNPSIGVEGEYVAFESDATNLVPGDTNGKDDVFIRDATYLVTARASVSAGGAQGNNWSYWPVISDAPGIVAFVSDATNLVAGDTNGSTDIFVTPGVPTYSSRRGTDRYDTAIKLSQAMFPGSLLPGSGLVLAPGETFQQALCGAPLAAAWGGPVLLTYRTALANNVKAEMQRLAPAKVFCIGLSTAAVNSVVAALPTASVLLITGADVYEMSRNVANVLQASVGPMSGAVAIITVGTNFPDAIGVSPLACARLWPIVLTNSGGGGALHPNAAGTLSDLGITRAVKVGTYAALPPGVTGLANLSGSDRYQTDANVANWGVAGGGLVFRHTGMATGDKFPDALAAGPYLGRDDGILLLSPLNGPLPGVISGLISAHPEMWHFSFIACIEPVISQVKALLP
jgi:hypothetical protein